jgi:putative transcriptional regulator
VEGVGYWPGGNERRGGPIVLRSKFEHWHCKCRQSERGILAAVAIVLSVSVLHAALPTEPDISGRTSLTGQLLIATPSLRNSPFERTVILLAQHNRDGAFGIVINRPIGEQPIANLLEGFGADTNGITGSVRIFAGGPVSPEIGFAIHGADYHVAATLDIDGQVALSPAPDVLHNIGLGKGPGKSLIAFGYAGWAASQLEDELARGSWYSVPEDQALVFDDDRSKVWDEAMALHNAQH